MDHFVYQNILIVEMAEKMTRVKKCVALTAIVILICTLSCIGYINYLSKDVDCLGNFSISNNVEKMSLLISRKMVDGEGIDTLSGGLYRKNVLIARVERTIKYHYQEEQGRYVMTSTDIVKGVHDDISDTQLTGCLAGMYAHQGDKNIVVLKNIGRSGWMVYDTPVPLYFCKRNT